MEGEAPSQISQPTTPLPEETKDSMRICVDIPELGMSWMSVAQYERYLARQAKTELPQENPNSEAKTKTISKRQLRETHPPLNPECNGIQQEDKDLEKHTTNINISTKPSDAVVKRFKSSLIINEKYYFWDKKRRKISQLYILEKSDDSFKFRYMGKEYTCSYEYAVNKLSLTYDPLLDPETLSRVAASMAEKLEHQKHGFYVSPDASVTYGD